MNDKFDELAKGLAQSVTRRGALKKFGVGFAGIVLASLGLANTASAGGVQQCWHFCKTNCAMIYKRNTPDWDVCVGNCAAVYNCGGF